MEHLSGWLMAAYGICPVIVAYALHILHVRESLI